MTNEADKFPRTPHLAWLGAGRPRDDKVLSDPEREVFLSHDIIVEEKVDGANLALYVDADGDLQAQNRGTVLGRRSHPQFDPLWSWLAARKQSLVDALGRKLTLYGEWCFAVHSVRYDSLPDWFLGFDILDRRDSSFWSTRRRNELLDQLNVVAVPLIGRGRFSYDALIAVLGNASSRVGNGPVEGLYLRREERGRLLARAKLVRGEFVDGLRKHWTGKPPETNRLASPVSVARSDDVLPGRP